MTLMASSITEKRKLSDRKRLESIRSKVSESNAKQKLIKDALRNLDSSVKVNSKIVFDDEVNAARTVPNGVPSEEQVQKKNRKRSKEKRNMALFDSDSEEDSLMGSQDMFRVKPQYEGETGQKIIALQSRFGNDKRFKIDERFVESDSEEHHSEEVNSKQETQRQLGVLAGVLGYELQQKPKDKLTKDWAKIKQMRYDPTQKNAAQLEIHEEEQSVAKTAKRKGKAAKSGKGKKLPEDEVLPKVSQERYFKVNTSLKEIFNSGKKSENESFSLLQSFGAAPSKDSQDQRAFDSYAGNKATNLPRTSWNNNPFKYDSSSDEEDEKSGVSDGKTHNGRQTSEASRKEHHEAVKGNKSNPSSVRRTFFVFEGDSRLEDGVKFFTRPDNMDQVYQNWKRTRFSLMEEFREKLKKAQQEKIGKTKMATAAKQRFAAMKSKFKSKKKAFQRKQR